MPLRLFALAVVLPFLCAGCMAQRDTPEMETDTMGGGMTPNGPAYLYGTWEYTMTEISTGEAISGTLFLEEAPTVSRVVTSRGVDAPLVIEEVELTNANFVLTGTVMADSGPLPITLAGSLSGDEMSAEADVTGMGIYALTGTRQSN